MTIGQIKEQVLELNVCDHQNENTFKAGVVLISSLKVGVDINALCQFTGYSKKRGIIQRFVKNMIDNNIYKDGVFNLEWETEGEAGVMALLMDILTVCGEVKRVSTNPIMYVMEESGEKRVENL